MPVGDQVGHPGPPGGGGGGVQHAHDGVQGQHQHHRCPGGQRQQQADRRHADPAEPRGGLEENELVLAKPRAVHRQGRYDLRDGGQVRDGRQQAEGEVVEPQHLAEDVDLAARDAGDVHRGVHVRQRDDAEAFSQLPPTNRQRRQRAVKRSALPRHQTSRSILVLPIAKRGGIILRLSRTERIIPRGTSCTIRTRYRSEKGPRRSASERGCAAPTGESSSTAAPRRTEGPGRLGCPQITEEGEAPGPPWSGASFLAQPG